jgi:hypothetical protein
VQLAAIAPPVMAAAEQDKNGNVAPQKMVKFQ